GSVARLLKDPAFREKILDTLDVTTVVRLLGSPRKGVSRRKARPLSHLLLSYARKIGRELGVNAIIVSTESGEELAPLKRLPGRAAFIVATSSRHIAEDAEKLVRRVLLLPQVPLRRDARLRLAALMALTHGLIQKGDVVAFLSGDGSGALD